MTKATDKPVSEWISARHVQHLVTAGDSLSLPMDLLLSEVGLKRSAFADVDNQVPISYLEDLLIASAPYFSDPLMGLHLAQYVQPATFGAIGYIAQACPHFSDVLAILPRFNGLLSDIGHSAVKFAPGTVSVHWQCLAGGPIFRRHASEYVLGAFTVLAHLLMPEQKLIFSSVQFTHEAPKDSKLLRDYLAMFKCPVYFSQPHTSITMPVSILKAQLRHGDTFMKDMLERHALQQLQQRSQQRSLIDDVRQLISAMLHEQLPDKDRVAAQLGMSGRSLHRKLQDLGYSYRDLLDDVRLTTAFKLLDNQTLPLAEVSDSLGFSTRQAFMRWFKQHTDKTTTEYRQCRIQNLE